MIEGEGRYAMVPDARRDPENAYYDIVWREPGRIDRILARGARYGDAVLIVEALNKFEP